MQYIFISMLELKVICSIFHSVKSCLDFWQMVFFLFTYSVCLENIEVLQLFQFNTQKIRGKMNKSHYNYC